VHHPDILAMNGASMALMLSDIPFNGPVGALRVGRVNGAFIFNPTYQEQELSDLDIVVSGTQDAILMVEGSVQEQDEAVVLDAIWQTHEKIKKMLLSQKEFAAKYGKPKIEVPVFVVEASLEKQIREYATASFQQVFTIKDKLELYRQKEDLEKAVAAHFVAADNPEKAKKEKEVKQVIEEIEREIVRGMILSTNLRTDGRPLTGIREIECEVGVLPRTHGSALFTRGQTQSLVVLTLGTSQDQQRQDDIEGEGFERFMLHYNFPPFSVGEVGRFFGPGRREIGHGNLAERALRAMLPAEDDFPYTMRVVSEVLESNGSSSMASVCAGSLSLMDAGVPLKKPVAVIAMGLIKEGERYAVLSDILGLEDHLGDMDFKITGTSEGITALQMDMKVGGISREIMEKALSQAKMGRLHILDAMTKALATPRPAISQYAPRLILITIPVSKIKDVIGPGGKTIRSIIEETGAKIDIDDDGKVHIASVDEEGAKKAVEMVRYLVEDAVIGKTYTGKVVRICNFGAFVEILPGTDGLVHISKMARQRIKTVEEVLHEGDIIPVKVVDIDKQGRISLSYIDALEEQAKNNAG